MPGLGPEATRWLAVGAMAVLLLAVALILGSALR